MDIFANLETRPPWLLGTLIKSRYFREAFARISEFYRVIKIVYFLTTFKNLWTCQQNPLFFYSCLYFSANYNILDRKSVLLVVASWSSASSLGSYSLANSSSCPSWSTTCHSSGSYSTYSSSSNELFVVKLKKGVKEENYIFYGKKNMFWGKGKEGKRLNEHHRA